MYQLILKVFELTKDFPRGYKFTLRQDMKRDAIVLVRSIYRANKANTKTEYLEQFLDDFEILKLEIRLCVDLKIMSSKWGKIYKCSQNTALRDIQDLIAKDILQKEASGGRSTNYELKEMPDDNNIHKK